MAYIEVILKELASERHPESGMVHRRVGIRLKTKTNNVTNIFLRFQETLKYVSEMKSEMEILRSELEGLRVQNRLLVHGRNCQFPLPTRMEWAKADHASLLRMNFIGADEMTVGDYHTLMGK